MVNHEIQQGMIQLSAPSISANAGKANGAAPMASPEGGASGSFAAILGAAGIAATVPESGAGDLAAITTVMLAGLPAGKDGKPDGKNLPAGDLAVAGDLETTNDAPDDATSDQADVPIAAAISVLPLIVPPLPGTDNPVDLRPIEFRPVESRAAGPGSAPLRPASLPQPAAASVARGPASAGVAPAQVPQLQLSPIVTADARPHAESPAGHDPSLGVAAIVTAKAATAVQPADTASVSDAPAPPPRASANVVKATPSPAALTNAAPISAIANRADATDGARSASRPAPAALINAAPVSAVANRAGATDGGATTTPRPAPIALANAAPVPAVADRVEATSGRALAASRGEPAPAAGSDQQAGVDLALETGDTPIRTTTQPAIHIPNASVLATSRPLEAASVATILPAASEQPHDFATLVDRLSEAREASSPQVVRTALQHAEFGRVSLQFRHDDANLSVTMANADPAFTSAVQSAVAASLAGSASGNGEQSRGDSQHAQQQQASAQQQSATSGNGQGQGQQQAAQARAEQAERNFHRAQAPSGRAQQGDASSPGQADPGARRSGIYA